MFRITTSTYPCVFDIIFILQRNKNFLAQLLWEQYGILIEEKYEYIQFKFNIFVRRLRE